MSKLYSTKYIQQNIGVLTKWTDKSNLNQTLVFRKSRQAHPQIYVFMKSSEHLGQIEK